MKKTTSWESSADWYDKIVGSKGHYYHQHVIIPATLNLLQIKKGSLLDLACGQGVLARHLPKGCKYLGVDTSASLIEAAKKYHRSPEHQFLLADLSQNVQLPHAPFSHATCILAIQNLSDPLPLFCTAHKHLQQGAPFLIVLNHPCFRIPRQSSWGIDAPKKLQYRRIDRYMSELDIPIQTGQTQTLSFHRPLSYFTKKLKTAGFITDLIEEWCSDKQSTGKAAAMENRSRREFPLFMAIRGLKP